MSDDISNPAVAPVSLEEADSSDPATSAPLVPEPAPVDAVASLAALRQDPGAPLDRVLATLSLTMDEQGAVTALIGVRTLGDLLAVLERGDVEKRMAAKLRKLLS